MAVTITPLGFKKPDGNELANRGDNVLADNAQTAQDLIAADRVRLGSIETTNIAQGNRLTSTESSITSVGSRLSYVEAVIATGGTGGTGGGTTNVGIDTDGVPYYELGASGATITADTDGVPYFF